MSDHSETLARLRRLEVRARGVLVARSARAALAKALGAAPALLCLVPGGVLLLNFGAWVGGFGGFQPGVPLLMAFTLLVPVLWVLGWLLAARLRPVGATEGLHLLDVHHKLKDRLVAAREFARAPVRSPFMEATVADAESLLSRVEQEALPPAAGWPELKARAYRFAVLALLLGVCAVRFQPLSLEVAEGPTAVAAGPIHAEIPKGKTRKYDPANPPDAPLLRSRVPGQGEKLPAAEAGEESRAPGSELPDHLRKSTGSTGRGESSKATEPSASSPAQGAPSGQGSPSKGKAKSKAKASRKKPKKKATSPQVKRPKKGDQASGATSGKGSGKGSGRNPVSTPWTSKDQVATDEEEDLEEDEDVDDESDDSESRGGMQPNLRDRRPPVSRDLTIGFGNKPSEDANGRGGPSEQKKSRGTASLVLGVPIPDHIKGRPNPGRTKVTQERVQPRFEKSGPIDAGARDRGQGSAGAQARPILRPWMRKTIRGYFLTLRARDASSGKGGAKKP